ncbi:YXWGXW repeat-containing protein [Oleomonas cavernae]|nr:YXWGXW repeat-containing protein [Oleomonas cavernae]
MMSKKLAFAFAFGLLTAGAATAAQARDIVIYEAPPPPRVEVVPQVHEREIWEPGHWARRHHDWAWIPGRILVVDQPGRHWEPGHWDPRPRGWIWIEGHWN